MLVRIVLLNEHTEKHHWKFRSSVFISLSRLDDATTLVFFFSSHLVLCAQTRNRFRVRVRVHRPATRNHVKTVCESTRTSLCWDQFAPTPYLLIRTSAVPFRLPSRLFSCRPWPLVVLLPNPVGQSVKASSEIRDLWWHHVVCWRHYWFEGNCICPVFFSKKRKHDKHYCNSTTRKCLRVPPLFACVAIYRCEMDDSVTRTRKGGRCTTLVTFRVILLISINILLAILRFEKMRLTYHNSLTELVANYIFETCVDVWANQANL